MTYIHPILAGLASLCLLTACSDEAEQEAQNNQSAQNSMPGQTTDLPWEPPRQGCAALSPDEVREGATLERGCYEVTSALSVIGGELILQPGAVLIFAADTGLSVSDAGTLTAQGSQQFPVVFTGKQQTRGFWKGISLHETGEREHVLEHAVVEYAGSAQWHGARISRAGVYVRENDVRLTIKDALLKQNMQAGLVADGSGATLSITSSAFEQNDAPLWLHANLAGSLGSDLRFAGNEDEAVWLTARSGPRLQVKRAQTWPALPVPYRVVFDVGVEQELTIAAGAAFLFEQDAGLAIEGDGRLIAKGSPQAPIVLSGQQATPGSWAGLYFHDTGQSVHELSHVRIEHAGGQGWHGGVSSAGVYMRDEDVSLAMDHVEFISNKSAGLLADSDSSTLTLTSSLFQDNEVPISLPANLIRGLGEGLSFQGNSSPYIEVNRHTSSRLSVASTWRAHPVPYLIAQSVSVIAPLTLSPGAQLVFEREQGLLVDEGVLTINGSASERVSLKGLTAQPGSWRGVAWRSSTGSVLSHADIAHAAGKGWDGDEDSRAALFLDGGRLASSVTLREVSITASDSYGVSVRAGSEVVCEGVTSAHPLYAHEDATLTGCAR